MNTNNQCFRMFNLMKQGYDNNNPDELEQGARCWLDLAPENPFAPETPEMEAFFQMKRCYSIWRSGAIDHKINRRRMIQWTEKLCSLNPKNPYKFDKKADEEDKAKLLESYNKVVQTVDAPKTEKVVLEQPVKVFGVPEEEKEEKKTWLQFLFPWKKVGE